MDGYTAILNSNKEALQDYCQSKAQIKGSEIQLFRKADVKLTGETGAQVTIRVFNEVPLF